MPGLKEGQVTGMTSYRTHLEGREEGSQGSEWTQCGRMDGGVAAPRKGQVRGNPGTRACFWYFPWLFCRRSTLQPDQIARASRPIERYSARCSNGAGPLGGGCRSSSMELCRAVRRSFATRLTTTPSERKCAEGSVLGEPGWIWGFEFLGLSLVHVPHAPSSRR